jgi:hypothetical protein
MERSKRGVGWLLVEHQDHVELAFNSRPDGNTLQALRQAGFTYNVTTRTWSGKKTYEQAMQIADRAQTWESVGEHPDGDDTDDFPIF